MAESERMTHTEREEPVYFPLFVNMEQKKLLVFGAGCIGTRRIGTLLRYGALVAAVAPAYGAEIHRLQKQYPGQLQLLQRCYCQGEISGERADYVLAATDDAGINDAIVRECRSKGIPVNHAGDRRQCDFYFPALVEQDRLVMGITSTDGDHKRTAKISAWLRDKLRIWTEKERG